MLFLVVSLLTAIWALYWMVGASVFHADPGAWGDEKYFGVNKDARQWEISRFAVPLLAITLVPAWLGRWWLWVLSLLPALALFVYWAILMDPLFWG